MLVFLYLIITALQNYHAKQNTTKGGRLSGSIVIILLFMYNWISYGNKQPFGMLWSSSQM